MMILTLVFMAVMAASPADRAESAFVLGNSLYAEADYRGALAAYEEALTTGLASAALYLNASGAAFEAGDLARSRLYAERAARFAPADIEIQRHTSLVRRSVGEPEMRPRSVRGVLITSLSAWPGAFVLLGGAFALWSALFAVIGLRLTGILGGPLVRRLTLVLGVSAILGVLTAFSVWQDAGVPVAVVMADQAVIFNAPAADTEPAATLGAGRSIRLGASRGDWREAHLPDGSRGWIYANVIEEV